MQGFFEDDGAVYDCSELVPGVLMSGLREDQKREVTGELLRYVKTTHPLSSDNPV
jgi:hypothetical protein